MLCRENKSIIFLTLLYFFLWLYKITPIVPFLYFELWKRMERTSTCYQIKMHRLNSSFKSQAFLWSLQKSGSLFSLAYAGCKQFWQILLKELFLDIKWCKRLGTVSGPARKSTWQFGIRLLGIAFCYSKLGHLLQIQQLRINSGIVKTCLSAENRMCKMCATVLRSCSDL